MTIGELYKAIRGLPDDLEITVRCDWEEEEPNGNCFRLREVLEDHDHGDGTRFVAFECDQESEAAR